MWRNSGMLITATGVIECLTNGGASKVVIHADTEYSAILLRNLLLEALNCQEEAPRGSFWTAG